MLTRQNENHVESHCYNSIETDGWLTNGMAVVKNILISWNEQQLPLPFRVSLCLPLCDLEPDGTSSCCQAAAGCWLWDPMDYLQLGIYKNPIGPTLVGCQSQDLGSVGNLLDDVAAKY